jgi:hypothetical protein
MRVANNRVRTAIDKRTFNDRLEPAGRSGNGQCFGSGLPGTWPGHGESGLVSVFEVQRRRIDAITEAGRLRPVVKYVPQMGAAFRTAHFMPQHAEA